MTSLAASLCVRTLGPLVAVAAFVLPYTCALAATGAIEGRVLHGMSGAYLENARVTVEGATLPAFTNNLGEYRLSGVPTGPAILSRRSPRRCPVLILSSS